MTSILFLIEQFNATNSDIISKTESFSSIFSWKCALNLEHFQKKMTLIADFFPKLRTPENVVRYMSKKSCFKGPFDRQHGKLVQTLLRSGTQDCYHIYWSFGR